MIGPNSFQNRNLTGLKMNSEGVQPWSVEENDLQPIADVLDILGVDAEEVQTVMVEIQRKTASRLICSCGHSMYMHSDLGYERFACKTGAMWCPCLKKLPVLEVSDTRYFQFKSRGVSAKHALSLGLLRLKERSGFASLIVPKVCMSCKEPKDAIYPTGLDRHMKLALEEAPYNILCCEECLEQLAGRPVRGWLI